MYFGFFFFSWLMQGKKEFVVLGVIPEYTEIKKKKKCVLLL